MKRKERVHRTQDSNPAMRGFRCSGPAVFGLVAMVCVGILATSAALADAAEDSRVRQRIEVRLAGQVALDLRDGSMEVADGIVTIHGNVGCIGKRERVVRLVSGIVGVRGVINEIEIRAGERTDAAIQQDIVSLLERRPRFREGAVSVLVSGGEARLDGEVDRALDRLDAETIAANVEGVIRVDNGIRVLSEGLVAPELILERVRGVLLNPLTFGRVRDLEVSVDQGGVVLLRGTAIQPGHREEAELLALSVPGVAGVINRIVPPGP